MGSYTDVLGGQWDPAANCIYAAFLAFLAAIRRHTITSNLSHPLVAFCDLTAMAATHPQRRVARAVTTCTRRWARW